MAMRFLSKEIWPHIRNLARRARRPALVAVPFVGVGAAKRLPLTRGDTLVTRFDRTAIRAGHVDPREIVKFIKRGVEVHAVANLHAKVYVFGRTAIVGSANVSDLSEHHLIEAGLESSSSDSVRACVKFVRSLMGDTVGLEFARREVRYYRPPQVPFARARRPSRRRPHQTDLVAVALENVEYDETDESASVKARHTASKQIANKEQFRLDDFRLSGGGSVAVKRGSRVLMCTTYWGKATRVTAPARVLEIRRYRSSRGAQRMIVVVEVRKYLRERPLGALLRKLGRVGKPLRGLAGAKRLRDPELVYKLGQLWSIQW